MDSPTSQSPSTPTSGDEDYREREKQPSLSGASPVPKRRAVASSPTGGPKGILRRPTGGNSTAASTQVDVTQATAVGAGGGPTSMKEELVDVAVMNELRILIGDPFDEDALFP